MKKIKDYTKKKLRFKKSAAIEPVTGRRSKPTNPDYKNTFYRNFEVRKKPKTDLSTD